MRRGFRVLMVLSVLLGGLVVGLLGPASAARADGCYVGVCGEVINKLPSGNYLLAVRDWCHEDLERLRRNEPSCGAETLKAKYKGEKFTYLAAGQGTDTEQDWDGFRVEPGCKVKYTVESLPFGGYHEYTSDRTNRGTEWIRVHTNQRAFITSRVCS